MPLATSCGRRSALTILCQRPQAARWCSTRASWTTSKRFSLQRCVHAPACACVPRRARCACGSLAPRRACAARPTGGCRRPRRAVARQLPRSQLCADLPACRRAGRLPPTRPRHAARAHAPAARRRRWGLGSCWSARRWRRWRRSRPSCWTATASDAARGAYARARTARALSRARGRAGLGAFFSHGAGLCAWREAGRAAAPARVGGYPRLGACTSSPPCRARARCQGVRAPSQITLPPAPPHLRPTRRGRDLGPEKEAALAAILSRVARVCSEKGVLIKPMFDDAANDSHSTAPFGHVTAAQFGRCLDVKVSARGGGAVWALPGRQGVRALAWPRAAPHAELLQRSAAVPLT